MGNSPQAKLFDYIDQEDVSKVHKQLTKHPEFINSELREGCPYGPLTRAVWRGDLSMVIFLTEDMKADINKQCEIHSSNFRWRRTCASTSSCLERFLRHP
jgi:hypothetical protein